MGFAVTVQWKPAQPDDSWWFEGPELAGRRGPIARFCAEQSLPGLDSLKGRVTYKPHLAETWQRMEVQPSAVVQGSVIRWGVVEPFYRLMGWELVTEDPLVWHDAQGGAELVERIAEAMRSDADFSRQHPEVAGELDRLGGLLRRAAQAGVRFHLVDE